ncbi:MAG: NAD+ synthase [Desulfonatronovibrionaceae bacterium]
MRIGILQLNPKINDLVGNADKIVSRVRRARDQGAELCITPEMALIGYPPKDFLFYSSVIDKCLDTAVDLAREISGVCPLILGMPLYSDDRRFLFNAAALVHSGKIVASTAKTLLPNYDVFDESRYFVPHPQPQIFAINGRRLGITVCEDIWNDKNFWESPRYDLDPVHTLVRSGAEIIINISASPFSLGKQKTREAMLSSQAHRHRVPIAYCNQCGGNDDLIFDGFSCALDQSGRVFARAPGFAEHTLIADMTKRSDADLFPLCVNKEEEAWEAMVLGCRDYADKCGFKRVVLGLSGGIDSALTAAVAAQAVGPGNVLCAMLPSPYTSRTSQEDSRRLAENLGVELINLSISGAMQEFAAILTPVFSGLPKGVTEENIQARIRGNLLMALANKLGALLLTTGNKSELAVGYCTIYGDMAGGLGVLSDVPKTMVYSLSRWLNQKKGREIIPENILIKAPSAELKPGQKDQDSLPQYETLDQILYFLLQRFESVSEITARGFSKKEVQKIAALVHRSEFKRKQAPPGLKITDRAFGTGWRMPIASYRLT